VGVGYILKQLIRFQKKLFNLLSPVALDEQEYLLTLWQLYWLLLHPSNVSLVSSSGKQNLHAEEQGEPTITVKYIH
jgi:hypothetical protein